MCWRLCSKNKPLRGSASHFFAGRPERLHSLWERNALSGNSASKISRGWIGLRIVKRVDFFQFTVADMHAVEDLIYAKDCLHFKDCCDKISLDNMLLDLDAFDGWQNTRQESDDSVPPDQLSYAWPLKGNIRGEGYFGYIFARQTSQIRLDNCDFFLS